MKCIKIKCKGACRYIKVTDSKTLDKFMQEGWDPVYDKSGNIVLKDINTAANSKAKAVSTKTSDVLAAINKVLAEEEAEDTEFLNELTGIDED
jgi:hypothetical protein